jgi:hypothetical protein
MGIPKPLFLKTFFCLFLGLNVVQFGCDDDDDDDTDAGGDTDTDTDTDADTDSDTDADTDSDADADTDTDTDSDTDTDTEDSHVVFGSITVPSTFDAVPLGLGSSYHVVFPDYTGIGWPTVATPDIGVDKPYEYEATAMKTAQPPTEKLDAGDYFVQFVLFVEGGGMDTFTPIAGVDYIALLPDAVTIGSGKVDLGTVNLELVE